MKKFKQPKFTDDSSLSRAHRELQTMKHKDLQKACIIRGLEPEKVVNMSDPDLANWFLNHHDRSEDLTLIPIFDSYVEGELTKRGYKKGDLMLSPSLRLGYTEEFESSESVSVKPKKQIEAPTGEKKARGELDEKLGVYKGTKKALTFQCAVEGKTIEETIEVVTAKYTDALDKSIRIWYRKALKALNDQEKDK